MTAAPTPPIRCRRGVALLTTLVVIVLLALISSGALHQALGDARRGHDASAGVIAAAGADAGAYALLETGPGAFDFDSMATGDTLPTMALAAGDARVVVRGRRTSPVTWWVTSFAFLPDSAVAWRTGRRVNLVLRQALPELATDAALTVRNAAAVAGTGSVTGTDTVAGSWAAGCQAGAGSAGIAVPDTNNVQRGVVTGLPALQQEPLAGLSSTYDTFGPTSWVMLAGRASVILAPGAVVSPFPSVAGSTCNRADPANWGEPAGTGPCTRHAPIVRARGDLEVRGGRGQGILLVDGDVVLSQGAEFHGLIVARDDILSGPGGGRVLGAAYAADSVTGPGDASWIGDGLRIHRSACAIAGVLRRNAPLVPVPRRSWAPMP